VTEIKFVVEYTFVLAWYNPVAVSVRF